MTLVFQGLRSMCGGLQSTTPKAGSSSPHTNPQSPENIINERQRPHLQTHTTQDPCEEAGGLAMDPIKWQGT